MATESSSVIPGARMMVLRNESRGVRLNAHNASPKRVVPRDKLSSLTDESFCFGSVIARNSFCDEAISDEPGDCLASLAMTRMWGINMTELLCRSDAYMKEFDATVTAVNGDLVALDRTAFYPRGGGQPSDTGMLRVGADEYRVLEVKKQGAEVWHRLDRAGPAVGARVHGVVDWDRRYKLMRTHTALHILCGVIFRDYGVSVTGGDIAEPSRQPIELRGRAGLAPEPLAARMDFELERMSATFAQEVEDKVNKEVAAARDIRVQVLPREKAFQIPDLIRTKINLLPPDIQQVRVVEIVGLDLQADGGTHVANTREVGRIKVVGHESKGKINKRLRIAVE